MLTYLLFIPGFIILIKGADFLVDGSTSIAKRFNISDFVVGLTIVSVGTSMPELFVNIMASTSDKPEIAIGNILGSNISNILLILGISAMVCPLPVQKNTVLSEIPFSLAATILVGYLANAALFDPGMQLIITRGDGMILLFFFILFMAYIFKLSKKNNDVIAEDYVEHAKASMGKSILMIVAGMLGLYFGGNWVVSGAVQFAGEMGMSETFIGLTVIAIGTSLPELVTSVRAAMKGNTDIAVGNVVGSNIFNLLWIIGISSMIKPLPFDVVSNTDILVAIGASTLLILTMATGKKNKIDRWEGALFVFLYISYTVYLIYRG